MLGLEDRRKLQAGKWRRNIRRVSLTASTLEVEFKDEIIRKLSGMMDGNSKSSSRSIVVRKLPGVDVDRT